MSLTAEEINRKLLHGLAVILPVGIFYGPHLSFLTEYLVCGIIGILFLFSLLVEYTRFRRPAFAGWFNKWFGSMLRSEEANQITGATYVLGGSFLCSLIALQEDLLASASAFLALSLFILGDAAAALVGKAIGRIKIGDKTIEGTLGCFFLCFFLAWFVFPALPDFTLLWGAMTIVDAFLLSALVAVLELYPIRFGKVVLNDNLYVPVVVTFAAIALHN